MAVGTPGRLCALAESGALPLAAVRLLVLDEADQLWAADGFRADVQWLAAALPRGKQARARAVGPASPLRQHSVVQHRSLCPNQGVRTSSDSMRQSEARRRARGCRGAVAGACLCRLAGHQRRLLVAT